LPDDLPWVTGSIGLLGTEPSYDLMMECDTLLMIGSAFPYSEFLPKEGQARGVQIDIDASILSIRFPMEVGLVGDAAETLRALLPRLKQKSDGAWRKTIAENVRAWWTTLEDRARQPAKPVNPQLVTWELSPRIPTARSSSATPVPAPTGLPAISKCVPGSTRRSRAAWHG
jgi:pyruvate dehydrogenase (quinone)